MFRPRFGRRRYYGGGGGGGLGLLLLGMQFLSFFNFLSRSDRFFPVTLSVLGLNVAAYLRPRLGTGLIRWPSVREACISLQEVWFRGDWKRLLTSPFVHTSDYHLYYNMASFMWKALTLERHFGSAYFAYMVSVFSVATGLLYLGLHYLMAEFLDQWSAVQSCAVGFSAVIFALKVVTTHIQPPGLSLVMGFFPVPTRLACWAELVVISVLFPNVSFVGHLAGILVGLAYVWGPLKALMDVPLSLVDTETGRRPQGQGFAGASYTYRAAPTGFRRNNMARQEEEEEEEGEDEEERELQEAMRLSLHDEGRGGGGRGGGRRAEAPSSHSPAVSRAAASRSERRDSLERDMQIAINRSIRDQGPVEPSPPEAPPPPFNPAYPPPPPPPNTEGGRSLPPEGTTVRRRHPAGGPPGTEGGGVEGDGNLEAIRAARLRKFGRETSL